jgi:hypothetical protein
MVDKLTLLFLSSELEMDDDDDEMKLKESVDMSGLDHFMTKHTDTMHGT